MRSQYLHRNPQRLRRPGRVRSPWIYLLYLTVLSLPASAQDLSVDDILDRLKESSETLVDASFLLTGRLIDPDGTEIILEIEVEAIPKASAVRAYFIQPDALADNFIVLDGDIIYNYLFLTNQVMLLDATDPDALGGLLPQSEEGEAFELSLDLEEILAGFKATVMDYISTPAGDSYLMRFDNLDPKAAVGYVETQIVDGDWYPYRLTYFQADGVLLFDLVLEDFRRDQGLGKEDVTFIPADAEVIDERN